MSASVSDILKARLRLMLRAERAFGIEGVVVRATQLPFHAPVRPEQSPVEKTSGFDARNTSTSDGLPQPLRTPTSRPQSVASAESQTIFPVPKLSLFNTPVTDFKLPTDPFTSPVLSYDEKVLRLRTLDENQVRGCTKCRLHETRTNTVFGEGNPDAQIMFIGEGPGENEDLQGRPFVGKAGQLLDRMIQAMGLNRSDVYICNIVKCRPPNNREPAPDEVATCTPYLLQQIEVVRPKVIVTLGRPATQFILQSKLAMNRLRGQWQVWRGIPVMPTYHPAYLLRNYTPQTRGAVWSDLKQVIQRLGLSLPKRSEE